jgi:hypothetical protein
LALPISGLRPPDEIQCWGDRNELLGQTPFDFLMACRGDSDAPAQVEAALAGGRAAVFTNEVRDKIGDVVQHFVSIMDISKHKQEEERLRFLLDELNHRTQNTRATALAIAIHRRPR